MIKKADRKQTDYNKAYNALKKSRVSSNTKLNSNLLYSLLEEIDLDMDDLTDEELDYWYDLFTEAQKSL